MNGILPALVRNSKVWDVRAKKLLTGLDLLLAHGFDLHILDWQKVSQTLGDNQLGQLAGNMMVGHAAAAVILATLVYPFPFFLGFCG